MAMVHNMLKVFRKANNNNGRCSDLECYLIPIVTQLQRDQRFNRMSDKILTRIIALQWDKDIIESLARELGFGNDSAELKLIKFFRVLSAVREATGLPFF